MRQRQRQTVLVHPGKQLGAAIKIQPLGHAVVGRWRVVRGVILVCPARGGACHGNQPVAPVGVNRSQRKPQLGAAVAAGLGAHLRPGQLAAVARDDIDDAKERIGAIHRRPGPGHKLHPVHQIQVDRKIRADGRLIVEVVVESHPVDQQQHAGVVVARCGKPPGAQVVVSAVVRHMQPAHAAQHLGKVAVAKKPDVVGGDHAHGGGRFEGRLRIPAGRGDLQLHELLQRQVGHVGLRMGVGHPDAEQPKRCLSWPLWRDVGTLFHGRQNGLAWLAGAGSGHCWLAADCEDCYDNFTNCI